MYKRTPSRCRPETSHQSPQAWIRLQVFDIPLAANTPSWHPIYTLHLGALIQLLECVLVHCVLPHHQQWLPASVYTHGYAHLRSYGVGRGLLSSGGRKDPIVHTRHARIALALHSVHYLIFLYFSPPSFILLFMKYHSYLHVLVDHGTFNSTPLFRNMSL